MRKVIFLNWKQRKRLRQCAEWHPKLFPRVTCQQGLKLVSRKLFKFYATFRPSFSKVSLASVSCLRISRKTASRMSSGQSKGHRTSAPKIVRKTGLPDYDCSAIMQLNLNQISSKSAIIKTKIRRIHKNKQLRRIACLMRKMVLIVCQRYNIIINCMKGLQFSFSQSIIATKLAPPSQPDPILLRIPPEPPLSSLRKQQNTPYHEYSTTSKYDTSALMYTPDVPVSPSQPRSQLPNTSPFNKRRQETTPRKYLVKPYETQIQVKVVNDSRDGNSSASIRSEGQSIRTNRQTTNKPFQSNIQEQIKPIKRPNNSFIKKLNFDVQTQNNQKTARSKQSSLLKSNAFKVDRSEPKEEQTPQRQIQQLRNKLTQSQNMNASLRMQYQIGRQKLAARQVENQTLKQDFDQLHKMYEESDKSLQSFIKMQAQFLENKSMMNMFCQEIQKQKETIDLLTKRIEQAQPQIEAMKQMNAKWQMKLQENDKKWQVEIQENDKQWESKLKKEKDAYHLQIEAQENEKKNLKEIVNSLKRQIEKLLNQISFKDQKIDNLQVSINESKVKIQQLQEELQKKRQTIQKLQQKNLQGKNKLSQADKIIKNLENQLEDQIKLKNQLIENLNKSQKQIVLKIQGINTLYRQNQKQKRKKQEEIDILNRQKQRQKQKHQEQIIALNMQQLKQRRKYQEQIILLQQQLTRKHQEQILILTNEIHEFQTIKKQLQQNISKTYKERDDAIIKGSKLQEINSKILVELAESNKQMGIFKVAISSKQLETDKLKKKLIQLELEISNLNQEKIQAEDKINELQTHLNKTQRQFQTVTSENKALTVQINKKSNKIAQLQQKIPNYDKVVASYREALNQLKSTFQQRWQQLKRFYQQQFSGLQAQLKEFSDAQNSKRNFRSFKKHQLAKQNGSTIVTTTATIEKIQTKVLSQTGKLNSSIE